ncbi:glycosyltransferase [Novosphingobium sp. FSY-8]|uniref:Glycosyltransferase n=1 Tax=Novosphingobium ovatum TaxID=1908523 RepID=A0ABW9XD06_9SPHN|nr:glycosyltransferase [Novosphingobium ovatum]NBC36362.1 glycosyltransferase [Novosphingobium ovatum]
MAKAQHILICFHDFNRGGTERIAIAMARHWVERGRQVTILCGSEGSSEGESLRATVDPRVAVVELTPPCPRSLTSRLRLGRAMAGDVARLAPDIVFLPGNFHLPLAPALSRIPGGPPVVSKISNPAVPDGIAGVAVRAVFRLFRASLAGIATMNTGLERDLRAILPDAAIQTLYDPVYVAPDAPARVANPDGLLRVLWAGRFEPQKDVGLALRTMAALHAQTGGRARLVMLGDGVELDAARRQIAAMGLGDVIATPGYVPALDPWVAASDVFFVSSRYEGGPAVAVEAMARGVPVVSTDCSHFLHDIMTTPEAGRIVPGRDPAALAEALVQVAGAGLPALDAFAPLIAHLEPHHCADAYLAWFDAVVAGAPGQIAG